MPTLLFWRDGQHTRHTFARLPLVAATNAMRLAARRPCRATLHITDATCRHRRRRADASHALFDAAATPPLCLAMMLPYAITPPFQRALLL